MCTHHALLSPPHAEGGGQIGCLVSRPGQGQQPERPLHCCLPLPHTPPRRHQPVQNKTSIRAAQQYPIPSIQILPPVRTVAHSHMSEAIQVKYIQVIVSCHHRTVTSSRISRRPRRHSLVPPRRSTRIFRALVSAISCAFSVSIRTLSNTG